jgi:phosphoglycolate phosphatase-like HAD superfamily hydrolase
VNRPALLAADLDGTLMESAVGPADPAIVEALRRAAASGIVLCLCTGRPTDVALPAARALGLDAGYVISYGGAETVALGSGSRASGDEAMPPGVERRPLTSRAHELVLETGRACGLEVSVCDSADGVLRDVLRGEQGDVARALSVLGEGAAGSIVLLRPSAGVVAVQSAGATKERALQRLAARLAVAPGDVAYLGDADDDAAALEWAGLGVAVVGEGPGGVLGGTSGSERRSPLAEAAADLVITRSGVAELLRRLASAARPG